MDLVNPALTARWLSPGPMFAGDPTRGPGPSEQWPTVWPVSEAEHSRVLTFFERVQPTGVCFHSDGYTLARVGLGLAERYRKRFPGLRIAFAVAGDYDRDAVPGYSDGWEEGARVAVAAGAEFYQLNCERAWKSRPKGSGTNALEDVRQAAPSLPLLHTSYGAPSSVDGDLIKPGYQGFGGHGGGSLWDFLAAGTPVIGSAWQWYVAKSGSPHDRATALRLMDAYIRSVAEARRTGRISAEPEAVAYLQSYRVRPDVSCLVAQRCRLTQWWCIRNGPQLDEHGARAIAYLSEAHRRGLTITQLQSALGVSADGLIGARSWAALAAAKGLPETLLA